MSPDNDPPSPAGSGPPAPVIRGLRTMAIVRWVLLLLVALVAAGTWWKLVVHSDEHAVTSPRFFCPMHPQIRSPNPGACPICFMTLEPIPDEHRGHARPPASASAAPETRARTLAPVMLSVERRQAIGVTTAPVTRRRVARELRLNAVIEALEKSVSELRVRTPGFVERVAPVETGQSVRAGEALVWLYSPEVLRAQEELLAARRLRAPLRDASRPDGDFGDEVERAARERLKALGLSDADIDRVAQRGQAERLFAIRSGGGVVTARNVSVGTYATPEMLLFQVTDLSRVWASASVPSEDLASVPIGTRGEFRSRGVGRVYEAQAALVEPLVSSDTRAARVRFSVGNGEPRLLPGDSGEIVTRLAEREQTLVPRDAVVDVGSSRYAFVERGDGVFVPREVELGPLVGEERVVERGLEPGERVVSRGLFLLDSESRLQASLAPAQPEAAPPAASSRPAASASGAAPVIARILELSARYRALVLLAGVALAVGGYAAMHRLKLDAIPDLSDSQVIVFTEWPGRSPTLVEDQVTYPLVTSLLGTPKVEEVRGQSMFGMSFVYVVFEEGTDAYWARSRVLEYLNTAQSRLPEGANARLGPDASGVGWVFQYALVDTSGQNDSGALRTLHDFSIRYALASVPGVAEIATLGGLEPEYQVTLDPQRLRNYGLSLSDVSNAVRRASGDVGGRLVEMSEREYFVRGRGYVGGVADLEAVAVRNDPRGTPVLVKDVGSVRMGGGLRRGAADWNGQGDVVSGIVVMRHGENALDVISRVRKRIDELRATLPKGVEIKTAYDRSLLIERSIVTLKNALFEEMFVVAAVIVLFLLHLRSALLPIVSLPLAVLAAFIPMWLFDIPATIMSLGGIAIAIGATVDAEIVMIEAAHKRLESSPGVSGEARRKLLAEAALEVTPAIFFSLLVIAVSFLPVFGLTGQAGKLFRPLAFTKTMVMLSAALLSITVAPALRDFLLRGRIRSEQHHPVSRLVRRFYEPFVHVALANPRTTVLIGLFAVLSALPVANKLGWEFMPPLDEGDLLYMPTTLPGISIGEARRQLQLQDAALKKFPEVESVLGKVGRADSATDPAPLSMVETVVRLKPHAEWRTRFERRWYHGLTPAFTRPILTKIWPEFRPLTRAELVEEMNAKLRFPGFTNAFTQPIRNRIDMLSTGIRTPVGIKIYGRNLEQIERAGATVERIVKGVGARSVFFERQQGGLYLDVVPRREALARYGLAAADVNEVVQTAIGGDTVTTTLEGRARYSVSVRYAESARSSVEAIREVPVSVRGADAVRVSDVADVRITEGPPMIKDESGLLVGYVYVDIAEGSDLRSFVESAEGAVNTAVANKTLVLPEGGRLRFTGQYELLREMERRMKILVPLALLLVAMLLYLQFKNFTEVLIVLASVPFALVGSVWALYLLDYKLSTAVWVGVIALVGLAAQTGVVMIVYIDQAYHRRLREGRIRSLDDIVDAHAEGTIQRVRPKLMTVGTMLVGLMPLLWAEGSGADVMKRIAAPMVGGLLTSAFLTLEIIPVIYTAWRYSELVHARLESAQPALARELDRYVWIARAGGGLLALGAALAFFVEAKVHIVAPIVATALATLVLAGFGYTWARRRALTLAFGSPRLPIDLSSPAPAGESHA